MGIGLSRILLPFLALFLFAFIAQLQSTYGVPYQVDATGNVNESELIDCASECARRCSKASRQNLCHRACGTCCKRCNCVPPGTSGNQDLCPCWAAQTTHGGRKKCP